MKYEITKEQILELSTDYSVKQYLQEWFPEAFKTELELNKWYKVIYTGHQISCSSAENSKIGDLVFIIENKNDAIKENIRFKNHSCRHLMYSSNILCYGIDGNTKLFNTEKGTESSLVETTPEEVETALINEANKRGYKPNNFKCISMPSLTTHLDSDRITWENNKLWMGTPTNSNCIFQRGEWAELIPEIPYEKTVIPMEKALKIIAKKMKVSPENIEIKS